MKKKYSSPVISIMEIEITTQLLNDSSTTTRVQGNTGNDEDGINWGGDTKSDTSYTPW